MLDDNDIFAQKRDKGFTIVELLIVIVVIGVLATITNVAFNAVQDRANNSRTEKAVSEFRRMLIAYATVNGQYPAGGATSACLGEVSNYPSGCWNGSVSATFNNDLKTTVGTSTLPEPYAECIYMYGFCRRGAAYSTAQINLDGQSHTWSISFLLKGNVRCTADGQAGGTWINASSTPNASGRIEYHSDTTLCRLILPNPATL